MKIAVLGSGIVGQVLAAGFVKHGHQVTLGTRTPDGAEIQKWHAQNPAVQVETFAQAAAFGDVVVLAVLGRIAGSAIELAGSANFAGKVVIDTTNPLADAPPVNGVLQFTTGPNESLGEQIQALLPNARVVKAFNSVGNARMVNPHYDQGTPTMFLCGDDQAAKKVVSDLVLQLGWEPFDCGSIVSSRALEPLCALWCLPGFLRNQWTHAFKLLTH
jgi:8-hydroxy-5-deazaflavin:NADPH oxidoreductase